ncbi:MAG: aminotransferase class V-fold PLP-dependent enzyme, partial [Proteobacteria bacterium]|nr:aminotransferase class V-fold PLP-dependent enzyme [Pseudomonadota bacterium]
MSQTQAYLDYNATAPIRPEVIEAVRRRQEIGGNPSSVHALGRDARRAVEEARAQVAALINARASEIVFTSGGTESNNLALNGLGKRHLSLTSVEHGS